MRKQKPKPHKRNRAIIALLLPVVTILWLMGWSLYWISSRKQVVKSGESNRHENGDVTFTMLMPEQKHVK